MDEVLPRLGWKEHVELPEWGLRLRAKLDTGARTSALHVEDIEEIAFDPHSVLPETSLDTLHTPVGRVRFDVVLGTRSRPEHHPVEALVIGHKVVRDTGARAERRPVIRTRVRCGPIDVVTGVTLTDRSGMNFRMLLGRLTLEGRCVVDPAHGYLMDAPRRLPRSAQEGE